MCRIASKLKTYRFVFFFQKTQVLAREGVCWERLPYYTNCGATLDKNEKWKFSAWIFDLSCNWHISCMKNLKVKLLIFLPHMKNERKTKVIEFRRNERCASSTCTYQTRSVRTLHRKSWFFQLLRSKWKKSWEERCHFGDTVLAIVSWRATSMDGLAKNSIESSWTSPHKETEVTSNKMMIRGKHRVYVNSKHSRKKTILY